MSNKYIEKEASTRSTIYSELERQPSSSHGHMKRALCLRELNFRFFGCVLARAIISLPPAPNNFRSKPWAFDYWPGEVCERSEIIHGPRGEAGFAGIRMWNTPFASPLKARANRERDLYIGACACIRAGNNAGLSWPRRNFPNTFQRAESERGARF